MLDAAKADFKEISVSGTIRQQLNRSFIVLLEAEREYT